MQRRLVIVRVRTGEDLLGDPEGHGYSRSAREPQPVGDRCGRVRRNVDTVESRRNGPQLSTRHDDDDDDEHGTAIAQFSHLPFQQNATPDAQSSAINQGTAVVL